MFWPYRPIFAPLQSVLEDSWSVLNVSLLPRPLSLKTLQQSVTINHRLNQRSAVKCLSLLRCLAATSITAASRGFSDGAHVPPSALTQKYMDRTERWGLCLSGKWLNLMRIQTSRKMYSIKANFQSSSSSRLIFLLERIPRATEYHCRSLALYIRTVMRQRFGVCAAFWASSSTLTSPSAPKHPAL